MDDKTLYLLDGPLGLLALRLSGDSKEHMLSHMRGEPSAGGSLLRIPCRDAFQLQMVPMGDQVGLQANRVDLHPFRPVDPVCVNLGQQWLIRVLDANSPLAAQLENFDRQSSAAKAGIVLAGSGDMPREPSPPRGNG